MLTLSCSVFDTTMDIKRRILYQKKEHMFVNTVFQLNIEQTRIQLELLEKAFNVQENEDQTVKAKDNQVDNFLDELAASSEVYELCEHKSNSARTHTLI